MSGSEDEREDFGVADEHSLLHGKLAFASRRSISHRLELAFNAKLMLAKLARSSGSGRHSP